jgi:hypothetical protein
MMAQIMLFRCSDQERVAQPAAAHFLARGALLQHIAQHHETRLIGVLLSDRRPSVSEAFAVPLRSSNDGSTARERGVQRRGTILASGRKFAIRVGKGEMRVGFCGGSSALASALV